MPVRSRTQSSPVTDLGSVSRTRRREAGAGLRHKPGPVGVSVGVKPLIEAELCEAKLERETGADTPSANQGVEFVYRLTSNVRDSQ